jgi:hypothetical protein
MLMQFDEIAVNKKGVFVTDAGNEEDPETLEIDWKPPSQSKTPDLIALDDIEQQFENHFQ